MGIFNRIKKSFSGQTKNGFPNNYVDDGEEFYIVSESREFVRSSVKGDFRSYCLNDGFCTTWKYFIVTRDWDGKIQYRIDGYGRSIAISPDGSKIVSSNESKEIAIFNSGTGEILCSNTSEEYLSDLLWTKNGYIIGTDSDSIFVMDTTLNLLKTIKQEDGSDFRFISGICEHPNSEMYIVVLGANKNTLSIIDFETGEIVSSISHTSGDELFYSAKHRKYWISNSNRFDICMFDSNLEEIGEVSYPGKKGVKQNDQEQDDSSYRMWTPLPVLSPNGDYFLVNDASGLLRLISANEDKKCYRTFSRDVLDFVESMMWLDDDHFVALLDGYRIVKMNIRGTNYLFDEKDDGPNFQSK